MVAEDVVALLRRMGNSPDECAEVAQSDLRRVERTAREQATARRAFVQAVMLARASGETMESIAQAAGISRQAVAKLIKREQD